MQQLYDRLPEFSSYYKVPVERLIWWSLLEELPLTAGLARKDAIRKATPLTNRGTGVEGDERIFTLYRILDDDLLGELARLKAEQLRASVPVTPVVTPPTTPTTV